MYLNSEIMKDTVAAPASAGSRHLAILLALAALILSPATIGNSANTGRSSDLRAALMTESLTVATTGDWHLIPCADLVCRRSTPATAA
jgi:hypothetical protein